jgi:hypothetical protein
MLAAMAGLPELDVARVRRWCESQVPAEMRDQVRVGCEVAARHLTIVEMRPPSVEPNDGEWTRVIVARLHYRAAEGVWGLYWPDRNARLHAYPRTQPSALVEDLLREIDDDPTGIFWG